MILNYSETKTCTRCGRTSHVNDSGRSERTALGSEPDATTARRHVDATHGKETLMDETVTLDEWLTGQLAIASRHMALASAIATW